MNILLDENIPAAGRYFAGLGNLRSLPGRDIGPTDLVEVDVLLVRSVTRVDRALLAGSAVKFVGSCTAGVDHVDRDFLAEAGIAFAHAPGANALSVVEYVVSALGALSAQGRVITPGMSLGVVGLGQVGGRLYQLMESLGFRCRGYDPLLGDTPGFKRYDQLEQVLQSDILSLHTPLTLGGPYPTRYLLDAARLEALPPGSILINTSRGAVVDNGALKQLLPRRDDLAVVLDVWEREPEVDPGLMAAVDLATPHIAGYSYEGKLRGTSMVHAQLCDWLGVPRGAVTEVATETTGEPRDWPALLQQMLATYDVRVDDGAMRRALGEGENRAGNFERLRREYPQRRELGLVVSSV